MIEKTMKHFREAVFVMTVASLLAMPVTVFADEFENDAVQASSEELSSETE